LPGVADAGLSGVPGRPPVVIVSVRVRVAATNEEAPTAPVARQTRGGRGGSVAQTFAYLLTVARVFPGCQRAANARVKRSNEVRFTSASQLSVA